MAPFFVEGISPWRAGLSYCSAMLLIVVSGCGYTFASYSRAMTAQFHISHTQTGLIFTVGCVGGAGVIGGWMSDLGGLHLTIIAGTTLGTGGWMAIAICAAGLIPSSFGSLLIFYVLTMQGLIMLYMAAILNIKNVQLERKGCGLGLLDMCYGLSPVLFSQIYGWGFDRGRPSLDQDLWQFFCFQAAVVCCCGLAAFATCYVPSHAREMLDAVSIAAYKNGLKTLDFWLLWLIALLVNMTMGWYTGSLGSQLAAFSSDLNASYMNGLLMACGVICRISAGIGSDHIPIARSTLLAIILVPTSLAFAALALFGNIVFLPALIMIGVGFGASWCLVPLQIADTFGAGFGSLWGLALVASALGPLLMQPIDSVAWSRHADISGQCSGLRCYQLTYFCASCICGLCTILSAIVGWRTRRATNGQMSDVATCLSDFS